MQGRIRALVRTTSAHVNGAIKKIFDGDKHVAPELHLTHALLQTTHAGRAQSVADRMALPIYLRYSLLSPSWPDHNGLDKACRLPRSDFLQNPQTFPFSRDRLWMRYNYSMYDVTVTKSFEYFRLICFSLSFHPSNLLEACRFHCGSRCY